MRRSLVLPVPGQPLGRGRHFWTQRARHAVNVLFLCHRFPYPPDHGGKIRSFNVIRHLTEQGHDVTVASLARSSREAQEAVGIAPYCARFFAARVSPWMAKIRMAGRVPSPIPSAMGYFYSPELARYVGGTLARTSIDLIFVHCAFVAPYVAHVAGIVRIRHREAVHLIQPARLARQQGAQPGTVDRHRLRCIAHMAAEIEGLEGRRADTATARRHQRVHLGWRRPVGSEKRQAHDERSIP